MTTLLAALLALAPRALAKDDEADDPAPEPEYNRNMARSVAGRTLNGHRFVSSSMMEDPFVTPYVDSGTEWGFYQYNWYWEDESPWPWDDGDALRMDMLTMAQSFRVSVALFERATLFANLEGAVQVAQDNDTALYSAAEEGIAYGGGAKLKLWGNDWFQAGLSFEGNRSTYVTASPVNALLAIYAKMLEFIHTNQIPTEDDISDAEFWSSVMFDDTQFASANGGLQMAAGIHDTAGVFVQLNMEYAESRLAGLVQREAFYVPGIGISLSSAPVLPKVPLGLVVAYQNLLPAESNSRLGVEWRMGFFYTGRDYVDVGIELEDHKDVANVKADEEYWQDSADEVRTHTSSVRTRVRVYF